MADPAVSITPAVSILIVSYNTREMTLACLRSVFEQTTRTLFELIVVDNLSSDGSADAIEAEFDGRLVLIRSEENLGFARANNLAAERATGEYLLLLNPDTVVLDGAIDRLVEFAGRRPDAGIWGGRTVFADGTLNPASCWRRQTVWNTTCRALGLSGLLRGSSIFNAEAYGGWARDTERGVDIVTGCFLLIRRGDWQRLGGFDPAFFMYGEEADLCLRAHRLGIRPRVTPDATIVHYGGASERVRADKLVRLLSAKRLLIQRHWPRWIAWYGVAMLRLWVITRGLLERARRIPGDRSWSEIWRRRAEWCSGAQAHGGRIA